MGISKPHEIHITETPIGEVLLYQSDDGIVKLDVRLEDETVWLTQPLMAELFQTTQQNISQHVQNIYEEGELTEEATHKKYLSVRQEGNRQVKRNLDYYNLDEFLRFNDRRVLLNAGTVSKQMGEDHAKAEYEKFEVRRREFKESLGEADYLLDKLAPPCRD